MTGSAMGTEGFAAGPASLPCHSSSVPGRGSRCHPTAPCGPQGARCPGSGCCLQGPRGGGSLGLQAWGPRGDNCPVASGTHQLSRSAPPEQPPRQHPLPQRGRIRPGTVPVAVTPSLPQLPPSPYPPLEVGGRGSRHLPRLPLPPAPSPICQAGPFKTRPAPPLPPGFLRRRFPGAAAEDAPFTGGGGSAGGACARRRGLSQRRGAEPRDT